MQRERETVKLRIPDTGTSWRRWLGNLGAWPVRGMHVLWRREAVEWIAAILLQRAHVRSVTLRGHSRGAAVAIYIAVLLAAQQRHIHITLRLTGLPRVFSTRRWREHYARYLSTMDVDAVTARGDPVSYLPPLWRHVPGMRWVGPRRILSAQAHHESYIREYDH